MVSLLLNVSPLLFDTFPLLLGSNPLVGLVVTVFVPFLLVLGATYLGVLGALQTFFGESRWDDVVDSSDD